MTSFTSARCLQDARKGPAGCYTDGPGSDNGQGVGVGLGLMLSMSPPKTIMMDSAIAGITTM